MARISANGMDIDMFSVGKDEDYIKMALQGVEAEIESKGWDNRPFLFWIARFEKGIMLGEIPLPDSVYENAADELTGFVDWCAREDRARTHLKTLLPDNGFIGLIFTAEGWHVPTPGPDATEEERAAFDQARREHTFHERPDRVECRTAYLTTTEGRKIGLRRVRGEVPELFEGEEGKKPMAGLMPAAIEQFLWVCDSIAPHNELEEIILGEPITGPEE